MPQAKPVPASGSQTRSDAYNCPICLDLLLEPVVGVCGHEFCKQCYSEWVSHTISGGLNRSLSCPLCRTRLPCIVPGENNCSMRNNLYSTPSWTGLSLAAAVVAGVSRRLADLIEVTFPQKAKMRRCVPLSGQHTSLQLPRYRTYAGNVHTEKRLSKIGNWR